MLWEGKSKMWLDEKGFNWLRIRNVFERVWEHPFDTKKRLMAVVVKSEKGYKLYIKWLLKASQSLRAIAQMYYKKNMIIWQRGG